MSLIYLVQSAGDLHGANGYSAGLLEAGHPKILVSFIDYMDRDRPIIDLTADIQPRTAPPPGQRASGMSKKRRHRINGQLK